MTRHWLRVLPIVFVVAFVVRPIAAQDRFADLDRIVSDELKATQTPGALVAVVQDGTIVHAQAIGVANIETSQPMSTDMVFPIASMTKMYTATTLMTFVEEGKVDLQAPIGKYIENLPPKLASVTVHQILSHTAGFRDDAGISNRAYDDSTIEEQVRAYTDAIFFTEPGDVFSYANQGFNIAGLIIEKVSGRKYSQVVQERVWTPLGMAHSTYFLPMAVTYPFSQTHIGGRNGGPPVVIRPMAASAPWPAGGMFSTLSDLARYATMFMNDGMLDGKQVIPAAVIKRLSTPNVPIHSQVEGGQYCYGLETLDVRGAHIIEHGGTLAGSATDFVMAPAQHVAVIVFANRQSHLTRTVDKALEIMLPLGPKPADPKPIAMTPDEAVEYVGRYSQTSGPGGGQDIVKTDTGIGMRNGNATLPLVRIEKDAFLVQFPGFTDPIRVEFVRGADGKIVYFHSRLRAQKRVQ